MVTLCCNDGMTKVETRRARLRMLIAEHGLSELAEKTGKPASQLNDMAAGRKSFGEKIADQLTAKIGLPGGWFELWIGEKFTSPTDAVGQTVGEIAETAAHGMLERGDELPAELKDLPPEIVSLMRLIESSARDGELTEDMAKALASIVTSSKKST